MGTLKFSKMHYHLHSVDFKRLPGLKSEYLLCCIYPIKQSFCIMYYLQRKKKKVVVCNWWTGVRVTVQLSKALQLV